MGTKENSALDYLEKNQKAPVVKQVVVNGCPVILRFAPASQSETREALENLLIASYQNTHTE